MNNLQKYAISNRIILFFARGFNSGCISLAPGTVGTIVGIPFYWLLQKLMWPYYLLIVIIAFVFGVWICDRASKILNLSDPPSVVWDEMVGFWLTMFLIPFSWLHILLGFVTFRFFDILKPWPISLVDNRMSGGLGIMLDDILAALYANIFLQFITTFI